MEKKEKFERFKKIEPTDRLFLLPALDRTRVPAKSLEHTRPPAIAHRPALAAPGRRFCDGARARIHHAGPDGGHQTVEKKNEETVEKVLEIVDLAMLIKETSKELIEIYIKQ